MMTDIKMANDILSIWAIKTSLGGLLIVFILLFYAQQKKRWLINRWKKSLGLHHHLNTFQAIYKQVDGFKLSRQARERHDTLDYIYGEINFLSFIALLSLTKPDEDTVFYDLGCGVGKAVLACAMVYPVQKSVGVELLPELYTSACEQTEKLKNLGEYTPKSNSIHFILGDFLTTNYDDATLIFVNSSTLFGSTWKQLCGVLNKLSQVKIIITTSKPLISDVFITQINTEIQMSWGVVPAYIHYRKTNLH
jgi:SAM-dependent methyltransferase